MHVYKYMHTYIHACMDRSDLEVLMQMVLLLFTCKVEPDERKVAMLLKMLREQVSCACICMFMYGNAARTGLVSVCLCIRA